MRVLPVTVSSPEMSMPDATQLPCALFAPSPLYPSPSVRSVDLSASSSDFQHSCYSPALTAVDGQEPYPLGDTPSPLPSAEPSFLPYHSDVSFDKPYSSTEQFDPRWSLPRPEFAGEKPPIAVHVLIKHAILASPRQRLRSKQIVDTIANWYDYYKRHRSELSRTVRHHLSNYHQFIKIEKEPGMTGKGKLWTYVPGREGRCSGKSPKLEANSTLPVPPATRTSQRTNPVRNARPSLHRATRSQTALQERAGQLADEDETFKFDISHARSHSSPSLPRFASHLQVPMFINQVAHGQIDPSIPDVDHCSRPSTSSSSTSALGVELPMYGPQYATWHAGPSTIGPRASQCDVDIKQWLSEEAYAGDSLPGDLAERPSYQPLALGGSWAAH